MNILTIDTILNKTYISVLLNNKEILKTIESDDDNYHSAYLIKTLKEVLEKENKSLDCFDYIGVNTGVGSFTGIRVGLTVSKIISNRLNIKLVPLQTTEVLSRCYNNKNIMLDARRNSVFYSKDGKNIDMISYDDAKEILTKSDEGFICDNSFLKRFEEFKDKLVSYEIENKDLSKVELELTKEKIENKEVLTWAELKPTYIQTPPIYSKN